MQQTKTKTRLYDHPWTRTCPTGKISYNTAYGAITAARQPDRKDWYACDQCDDYHLTTPLDVMSDCSPKREGASKLPKEGNETK